MTSTSRRSMLTIKQKLQLIKEYKSGNKSKTQLANEFKCDVSTIGRAIRMESKYIDLSNTERKRLRASNHKEVEKALKSWYDQSLIQNKNITTKMLLNKAKEFSEKLNVKFKPNPGWLWRWQKRENVKLKKDKDGNINTSTRVDNAEEFNDILQVVRETYSPKNIFNADESALLYKILPNEIDNCKNNDERFTLLFLCNATGDYKEIFIIGRPENDSFDLKNESLKYFCDMNALMTIDIWNSILSQLDEEMKKENRKIVLFMDNAPCHKVKIKLEMVDVKYISLNKNSLIQPLNQGIIHNFKSQYRQIITRTQNLSIEQSISILDTIHYIKRAWHLVKKEDIMKCFQKAGFILNQGDKEDQKDVLQLPFLDIPMNSEQFSKYIDCDADIQCYKILTENDIIEEILQEKQKKENIEEKSIDLDMECDDGDTVSNNDVGELFESILLKECNEKEITQTNNKTKNNESENNNKDINMIKNNEEKIDFRDVFIALNILRKYSIQRNLGTKEIEDLEEKIFQNAVKNASHSETSRYFSCNNK